MNIKELPPLIRGEILLNRFILLEKLTPHVFVALDNESGNKVVVKQTQEAQRQREWHSMMECSSPYIIQPLTHFPKLLVLPYIEGKSLLTFSVAQSSLFITIIPQLVRAIHSVHQAGWVHGDIKPSNVLYLSQYQVITLIDFGAALPVNTPLSTLDEWQLTPGFTSILKQQGVAIREPKDDWYALKQWLEQIDPASLSSRDKHQYLNWTRWLGSKCNETSNNIRRLT